MPGAIMWAIMGGLGGAALGSFIATLVIRWPDVGGLLSGRSRCDSCGAAIPPAALVPMISYAAQKGRARCCGAAINALHPWGELLAILIGAGSFALLGAQGWIAAIFGWTLLALALFDLRYFVLPNWLTAILALTGIASAALQPDPSLGDRLIAGIGGYGALQLIRYAYRAIRRREGLGGGDPKLLGAIGLWVGWQPLPLIMLLAALTGLTAAGAMFLQGQQITATRRLPLGTLMAVAAWPVWIWWQSHPAGGLG